MDGACGDDSMSGEALRRRTAGGGWARRGGKNMRPGVGVSQERMPGDSSSSGRGTDGGVCGPLSSSLTGDEGVFLECCLSDEAPAILPRANRRAAECCRSGVVGGGITVLIVVCWPW